MQLIEVDPKIEEDRFQLNLLDKQIFPDDDLCPKDGYWWLAKEGQKPVGFAGIRRLGQPKIRTWYLCRSGILTPYRGQGFQVRAIRARINFISQLTGGNNTYVSDTYRNPHSANNLIKCGFRAFDPRTPWADLDCCYWRLVK